jgi:hypothetical protein
MNKKDKITGIFPLINQARQKEIVRVKGSMINYNMNLRAQPQ